MPKIPARLNISDNFSNNKGKTQSSIEKKRVENHEKFNKEINQANYVLEQLLETCNKMLSTSQVQENSPVKIEEALQMIKESSNKDTILKPEGENLVKSVVVEEQKNNVIFAEIALNKLEENTKVNSKKNFEVPDDYPADFEVLFF